MTPQEMLLDFLFVLAHDNCDNVDRAPDQDIHYVSETLVSNLFSLFHPVGYVVCSSEQNRPHKAAERKDILLEREREKPFSTTFFVFCPKKVLF